ncbi:ABC transporter ATP-binding protein [Alteromonadaceae bacterium M269]|nr:ABC transporter ATP-binding protein [Alteromonadaceae bacterium M269]
MPDTDVSPIIQLNKVSKTFVSHDVEIEALRNIDLRIDQGEYLTINGPSGCGKSTLLSIIGLLDAPTSGQCFINEVDTQRLDENQQAELRNLHIGFVFQSFNLIDEVSVFDNVALPLTYREDGLSKKVIHDKVTDALSQVGMDHRKAHKPNQLSGGQQQRVAIARAVAGDPSILLVDEPTGNLDSKNGSAVMDILATLNEKGTTICMVTHDPRYASHAKRQVSLLDGRIVDNLTSFDSSYESPLVSEIANQ